MKPAQTKDPRSIAVAAAARGWMDAGAVWDAAVRHARAGGEATCEDVLSPSLAPEHIAALGAEDAGDAATVLPAATMLGSSPSFGPVETEGVAVRPPETRYLFGEELGKGGVGRVVAAEDGV